MNHDDVTVFNVAEKVQIHIYVTSVEYESTQQQNPTFITITRPYILSLVRQGRYYTLYYTEKVKLNRVRVIRFVVQRSFRLCV
jgi:hypothetical protein